MRAGNYYGVLWRNDDGSWSGGWASAKGPRDGEWTIESVLEWQAREHVEAIQIPTGDPYAPLAPLAELAERRDAPWRVARKRASDGQVSYATTLGVAEPEALTSGACSDEIERVLATRRLAAD